jgi:hypothetical protein
LIDVPAKEWRPPYHARVLRVEQGRGKDFGVAAEIRRMDILPEIPA